MDIGNALAFTHAAEILAASPMGIKIIELLSSGIGSLSEPWLIIRKSESEAMAYAHRIYAEELAKHLAEKRIQSANWTIDDKSQDIAQISKELSSISRVIANDLRQQENISSIFIAATGQSTGSPSDQKVSEDWFQKFISEAKDISDKEVQNIWGRILAGEIERPGSFSVRSLSTLKNISTNEAQLFHKLASQSLRLEHPDYSDAMFPFVMLLDNKYLLPRGIPYGVLTDLQDAGLIHLWPTQQNYNLARLGESATFTTLHRTKQIIFKRGSYSANDGLLHVGHVSFSRAGKELARLATSDDDFSWWPLNSTHTWFQHGGWAGTPQVEAIKS